MTPSDPSTTLSLIDEALDGSRPTSDEPEERELQELALLLEADTPEPDPGFAGELEERVREGFPGPAGGLRARVAIPAFVRRLPRPAGRSRLLAGAAATLVLATAVTVALTTGESDDADVAGTPTATPLEAPAARQATEDFGPAGTAGETGDDVIVEPGPVPPGDSVAPGERVRRIERSAEITLAAPGDRLEQVADDIVAVADRRGGFVLRSEVSSGDEGSRGGSFELRIPAGRLQQALRDLSALADVRARSQSGEDITPAYVTARDQLVVAKGERRSLLRRLRRADSDAEADSLRDRLLGVSAQIRGLRGELRRLRERTDYASVAVELEVKDGDGDGNGGSGMGDAFDDAADSLVASFGLAVRVLGVLIPIALLCGLAWLAASLLRRRRREAALS